MSIDEYEEKKAAMKKIVDETGYDQVCLDNGIIRNFDTGASRDTADGKLDYEGFLSPAVLKVFAQYMHKNRKMQDGSLRSSDNWQKGIPIDVYMKSLHRHFMDLWLGHRLYSTESGRREAICGIMFNAMGYLHSLITEGIDVEAE